MEFSGIFHFIAEYKYLAVFLLACLEGRVTAVLVGFLIYTRQLDPVVVYLILVAADLVPHSFYYYLGRLGEQNGRTRRYLESLKAKGKNLALVEKLWHRHPMKSLLVTKFVYGLSAPFLICGGLFKIPYRKFFACILAMTALQYGILILIGYLFGQSYGLAVKYVKSGALIATFLVAVFVVIYLLIIRYSKKEIREMESE